LSYYYYYLKLGGLVIMSHRVVFIDLTYIGLAS